MWNQHRLVTKNQRFFHTFYLFFFTFYKFYTNPTRNEKAVELEIFEQSRSGDGAKSTKDYLESGAINLWTLNINEIILNHTDYNRTQKVLGDDLLNKLRTEKDIYDKIHENYYNGLQSFCNEWDNWNNKDFERIKKIRELKLKLDKIK